MYYGEIKPNDVANGTGARVTLFVSGCTHHCKDCFNEETWDFEYGRPFTEREVEEIIDDMRPAHIAGLTLLGGEPLEPVNQEGLLPLLRRVHEEYPDKTVWCYTGYLFDRDVRDRMCRDSAVTRELLSYIDILVDGRFMAERKNLKINFRGSDNQRIIDVKKSLETDTVVHWEGEIRAEHV